MTDPAGLTIFSDGLNLDIGFNPDEVNRLEEQEELEDQQRRHSEIRNELQNAFDDLLSDDNEDTTIDDGITTHSTVDNSDCNYQPTPSPLNQYQQQQQPQKQCNNFQNNQIYQNQIPPQPALIKQLSPPPLQQPRPPIKLSVDQEADIIRLRNELACEKRRYEQHVNDLNKHIMKIESQLTMAEAGRQQTHELLVESKSKCSDQEHFIQTQKLKIKELQGNLIEHIADIENKNTIISDLQHKYDFVAKQTDNRHVEQMLKRSNETYQAQIEKLQQQIQNLENKLDNKDSELNAIFARYNELQKTHTQLVETQLQHEQTIATNVMVVAEQKWHNQLKQQTTCNINEHQRFSNDMESLKRHIYELEIQLDTLKINEKKSLIQINKYKDDFVRLTNDINNLNIELEKKNNILCNMNVGNGLLNGSPNITLLPPPPPPPPLPQIQIVADLTESSTQTDLIQLENEQLIHKNEIDNLNEKLFNAEITIQNLNKQIQLLQTSDSNIIELKEKAAKFEDFIQKHLQNSHSKSSQTNTSPIKSISPQSSSPITIPSTTDNTNLTIQNDRILTQVFASKIKSIEQSYQTEINQYLAQVEQTNDYLNIKNNECELLKEAILSERKKFQEILEKREQETKEIFEKLYFLFNKCRDQLELSESNGKCLKNRIEWYREQFEKQQSSLQIMLTEWSQDKQHLVEKEQKLQDFEQEKQKLIETWQIKYKSAKKTAASYKKYAEDKDIHIANENERIKCLYENAVKRERKPIQ